MGGPALVADLDAALRQFAVPEDDREAVVATHEAVCRDPTSEVWVRQVVDLLRATTGQPSPSSVLPPRPAVGAAEAGGTAGAASAYLPVVALASALPDLLDLHAELGVPPQVTADTLVDVGRMLARNRVWFGEAGLGDELARWLNRHLRGSLLQVGRLQFERVVLTEPVGVALRDAGFAGGPGDLALNLHIPDAGGPLSAEAVDSSLSAAREGFARWFPDEVPVGLVCTSWLLDPQLLEVLPERSNLVGFQRRFTLADTEEEGEDSVRRFVLGDLTTPREDLVATSRLGGAMLRHWQDGGQWHVRHGWIAWS